MQNLHSIMAAELPLISVRCEMPILETILTLVILGIAAWLVNNSVPLSVSVRAVVNVALALIVVGVLLWLVNTYVPMAKSLKAILNIVVVIATCVKVLQYFGWWGELVRVWDNVTHRQVTRV